MADEQPLVLLVGHCGADSYGLDELVAQASPNAKTSRVNSVRALRDQLNDAALLLVNRQLDGRFGVAGGIELIRTLRAEGVSTPMMLVSNFPDAQEAAIEAGAAPGFGKRELRDPATVEKVRTQLA